MNSQTKSQFNSVRNMIHARESSAAISSQINDTLKTYVNSHCVHPRLITYIDKFTNEPQKMYVPCGHCYNCRCKYQGEWCSRMILHTLYCAKYCYFVTLTYGSFDNIVDIPKVLLSAYYRKDNFNKFKRYAYSPCLLRHEHFQRFMKYLRKIHGNDEITFFQCGEYGSTFGRPHFHLILWSNEPISKSNVIQAWSARCPNSNSTTLIGRVDFHDLNANGTVVPLDGKKFVTNGHNLNRAFNYVSKYITKSMCDQNDKVDAVARLKYFIYDLTHGLISDEVCRLIFNNRVRSSVTILTAWASYMANYYREHEFTELSSLDDFYKYNKKYFYDYESSDFSYTIFAEDVCGSKETLYNHIKSWHMDCPALVFRKVFKPYCQSSRLHAIGSDYVQRHVEEYSKCQFNLPTYNGKKLLLPAYFVRITKEYLIQSTIQTARLTDKVLTSPNLLLRKDYFSTLVCNSLGILPHGLLSNNFSPLLEVEKPNIKEYMCKGLAFHDYIKNAKGVVYFDPSSSCNSVYDALYIKYYRYSRKYKSYVPVGDIETFSKFVKRLNIAFSRYSLFYANMAHKRITSFDEYSAFVDDMCLFVDTFLSTTFDNAISDCYSDFLRSLNDLQLRYRQKHIDKQ